MSPAAPEATNRASTTPRREGVARFAGRGGEVAMATGRTPRIDADPKEASRWRPDPASGRPLPPWVERGQEPFRPGWRHNHQTPIREGEHATWPGGGRGGAGRDGDRGRVQRGRGQRRWRGLGRRGGPGGAGGR